jgi:hypothetical protein
MRVVIRFCVFKPGTGRTGTLSLRGQRFTLPMRNALRKEVFPIDVSFTPSSPSQEFPPDHSIVVRKGKEWHVKLYQMVKMVVNVRNECSKFPFMQCCEFHNVL